MDKRVQAITAQTLTPLVQKVAGTPSAQIASWQIEPVHGGWGGAIGGTAIYRLSGETERGESWSLILKILYKRPGETEASPYYWKREYEIYNAGILAEMPASITTPTIYDTAEYPDCCWLWMADIKDSKTSWTLDDYNLVARRLGRFNGAYLMGLPIPDAPWLSSDWHCRLRERYAGTFQNLDTHLNHPLNQIALPLSEKENILAIWQQADRYCESLRRLPQTFCHLDAFRRNIFHSPTKTILIDWALAGRAAIGEELVTMVALGLYFDDNPATYALELDQAVFTSYVEGLHDAGWQGDAKLARLGYTCAMTLRGLAGVKQDLELLVDEQNHAQLQRILDSKHKPMAEIAHFWAEVRRFRLLKMAAEARGLMEMLS